MLILDRAGATLPRGLEFLEIGWWAIHIAAVAFVFMYGFRRGRAAERREQRERAARAAKSAAAAGQPSAAQETPAARPPATATPEGR